jgi:hypothetical protein
MGAEIDEQIAYMIELEDVHAALREALSDLSAVKAKVSRLFIVYVCCVTYCAATAGSTRRARSTVEVREHALRAVASRDQAAPRHAPKVHGVRNREGGASGTGTCTDTCTCHRQLAQSKLLRMRAYTHGTASTLRSDPLRGTHALHDRHNGTARLAAV